MDLKWLMVSRIFNVGDVDAFPEQQCKGPDTRKVTKNFVMLDAYVPSSRLR